MTRSPRRGTPKKDLLDLLALAHTYPSRGRIVEALCQFYERCGDSGLPELDRLATSVQT